jgi:hypothetical protein
MCVGVSVCAYVCVWMHVSCRLCTCVWYVCVHGCVVCYAHKCGIVYNAFCLNVMCGVCVCLCVHNGPCVHMLVVRVHMWCISVCCVCSVWSLVKCGIYTEHVYTYVCICVVCTVCVCHMGGV